MLLSDTYCSNGKKEELFKLNSFFNRTIIITPISEEIDKLTEIKNNINNTETSKILYTDKITYQSALISDSIKITDFKEESTEINTIKIIESIDSTENLDINEESEIFNKTNEIKDITTEPNSTLPIGRTEFIDISIETNKITDIKDINEKTEEIIDKCNDEKKIINNYKKCVCNNDKGYYPLKSGETIFEQECYNMETKPNNFYLNEKYKYFEVCYESCKTCIYNGNEKENNCTSCIDNIIFEPLSFVKY